MNVYHDKTIDDIASSSEPPPKRKRGRPPKNKNSETIVPVETGQTSIGEADPQLGADGTGSLDGIDHEEQTKLRRSKRRKPISASDVQSGVASPDDDPAN